MKNTFRTYCASTLFAIALAAIISLAITACPGPETAMPIFPITPALTGTVSISGSAQVGRTLTANTGSLSGNGDITYQWKRGTTVIGANNNTYTVQAADIGSTITVTVTRSGYSGNITSAPTAVVTSPELPALIGTVSISGTAQVGQTLTANTGSLGGSGTISYEWKRGTDDIGAHSSTYIIQAADVGSAITVTVTRSGYSGSITSAPTAVVTDSSLPALTGTVSISGTAQVGQTLTVNTGALGGSGTITYQWKRGTTPIEDTDSSTYTVQSADAGYTIAVTVTRSGNSGSITSVSTAVVTSPELPTLTGTISISGTAQVGQTLTANTNSLGGSGTIAYQWKRGTTPIEDSDSSVYTVQSADVGYTIAVTVTRSGYSGSVTSAPTSVVTDSSLPALTGTVSISGTAQVGQTLTANTGSLGGSGAITYQWKRGTTPIENTDSSAYTLQSADVGYTIAVTVTRSGNSGSITSASTTVVTSPELPALTGTVSISGFAGIEQILTADTSSLGGSGAITYQWKRGGTVIGTDNSYTVQSADVGYTITVTVTRSGYSGSVTSAPTAVVTLPALTGTVSISGFAGIEQILTADTSSLGGSGTIAYQWKRGGTAIGANGSSYTVQSSDVGSTITVTVTRSGYSGSVTSAPTAVVTNEAPPTPGLAYAKINGDTAWSVSRGTATAADVVIPALHEGLPVTAIANNGFSSYTNMTSIKIPDRITNIGNYAFSNCTGLTIVTIPNSVTNMGSSVLSGCTSVTSVTVPFVGSTLSESYAFIGYIFGASNYSGQNAYIPLSLKTVIITSMNSITSGMFYGCTGLTSVMVSGETGNGSASSGWSVTISNNVTSIGDSVFYGCTSLTNVTIGNRVTSIGNYAFSGCSGLTNVTIGNRVTSIGNYAFSGCSGLTDIPVLPTGVTSIPDYAFQNCTGLTSVTIGNSVTSIGSNAFNNCTGLTSVTIGNSVTSIGSNAFNNCTGLPNITIPNTVTSIGSGTFSGCTSLTSITIPFVGNMLNGTSYTTRFSDIFGTVPTSLKTVVITGGNSIGYFAFNNCTSLTSITIPDSVTSIDQGAFDGCTSLTSITIPFVSSLHFGYIFGVTEGYSTNWSVSAYQDYIYRYIPRSLKTVIITGGSSIPICAFYGCRFLTSVTIGNSVTSIGGSAFQYCSGLTSVTIGNSVTSIGSNAFYNCTGLTSVTIPNSVTRISDWTFSGCTGLTSITIPNSVTYIDQGAFYNCTSLTSVIFQGTPGIHSDSSFPSDLCAKYLAGGIGTYTRSGYGTMSSPYTWTKQ
jgi:hypothetical protein